MGLKVRKLQTEGVLIKYAQLKAIKIFTVKIHRIEEFVEYD